MLQKSEKNGKKGLTKIMEKFSPEWKLQVIREWLCPAQYNSETSTTRHMISRIRKY